MQNITNNTFAFITFSTFQGEHTALVQIVGYNTYIERLVFKVLESSFSNHKEGETYQFTIATINVLN